MTSIEIEYCVPCGLRDSAEQLQERLLDEHEADLDELILTMGDGGVFIVRVDGDAVYDSSDDHEDMDGIVQHVTDAVEQEPV